MIRYRYVSTYSTVLYTCMATGGRMGEGGFEGGSEAEEEAGGRRGHGGMDVSESNV